MAFVKRFSTRMACMLVSIVFSTIELCSNFTRNIENKQITFNQSRVKIKLICSESRGVRVVLCSS